jgi:hypothetical protein
LRQEQDRPSALVTYHVVASASKNKQPENIEPTPAANASKKPEGKI